MKVVGLEDGVKVMLLNIRRKFMYPYHLKNALVFVVGFGMCSDECQGWLSSLKVSPVQLTSLAEALIHFGSYKYKDLNYVTIFQATTEQHMG
jgi:hypothetical protein